MWLYVPPSSDCSPSALAPTDLVSASNSPSSISDTEPALFVSSNGKPVQRPLSWRGWQRRPWIRLLSGTTSPPLTAARGVDAWMESMSVSHASRIRLPAIVRESRTTVGYSQTSFEPFARYDRCSGSLKTCQASLALEGLTECSPDWPRSGMMRNGTCFPLKRLEAARSESASSCSLWQTPAVDSFRSRGGSRKTEMGLDQQARSNFVRFLWSDQTATPAFRCSHPDQENPPAGEKSSNAGPNLRRRLNPTFVEWLMGWPIRWTALAPTVSDSPATEFARYRQQQLFALCGWVGRLFPQNKVDDTHFNAHSCDAVNSSPFECIPTFPRAGFSGGTESTGNRGPVDSPISP